jgi:hypothetical protein
MLLEIKKRAESAASRRFAGTKPVAPVEERAVNA